MKTPTPQPSDPSPAPIGDPPPAPRSEEWCPLCRQRDRERRWSNSASRRTPARARKTEEEYFLA
jgi:hypothetical protein